MKNIDENNWKIDGDNNVFKTLKDAKWHILIAYTPKERVKWLYGCYIIHTKKGEIHSLCRINIDMEGNYSFGKVKKY